MPESKFRELQVATNDLARLLFDSGYVYGGESLMQIVRNLTQQKHDEELRRNLQLVRNEKMAREKKILESRRVAVNNGHGGQAFDAQKIPQSDYDRKQLACYAIPLIKIMLYQPGYAINRYTLLIRTTDGIYSFPCEVQFTECLGHIRIKAKSPAALRDVTVLGYRILESYGLCIRHIESYMPQILAAGEYVCIDCNVT